MALRDLFGEKPKRFVTPEEARRKLDDAAARPTRPCWTGWPLRACRSEDDFRVEYYFYTDTVQKAKALASDLGRLGYEVEYRPSTKREGQIAGHRLDDPDVASYPVVNGWTRAHGPARSEVRLRIRRLGLRHAE